VPRRVAMRGHSGMKNLSRECSTAKSNSIVGNQACGIGAMFGFRWNMLSGSILAFNAASRR
jgi:hypothetical protein